MADRLNQHRCNSCHNNYSSRKVLVHHLLMVHGQRLRYASRRPVDLNVDDLRQHIDQARDAQRRAYTLLQEARQAPSAAEGRRRDWNLPGGQEERRRGLLAREEEQRRGLQARMGRAPPREGHPATRIGRVFLTT